MFKPGYVWPNKVFPFRIFYEGKNLRIFIIENLTHNYEWLSKYSGRFRDTDVFFVYFGWFHGEKLAGQVDDLFVHLKLDRTKFYLMYNSEYEMEELSKFGFEGNVINHNAWLDYNFVRPVQLRKKYSAIYVARYRPFKRHYLASDIKDLALVLGSPHGNISEEPLPPCIYRNHAPLKESEVFKIISESRVGLALSEVEGACFSSSEYLLCDIPVVSTISKGGRDLWYTNTNSVIVDEPTPLKIKNAVYEVLERKISVGSIRMDHIKKQDMLRTRFIKALERLLYYYGEDANALSVFESKFFHKLRRSCEPNFENIWPASP